MIYAIFIIILLALIGASVFMLGHSANGSGVSDVESQFSETSRNNQQQRDINKKLADTVESLDRNNRTARDIERENQDIFERIEKRNANKQNI